MTNLPIASNNSQLSANVASTAKKDDATNVQSADPFGAVLAQQMDEANTPASNMPSTAAGVDAKTMADSAASTGKAEPDKVPTAPITSGDPSSALAIMLQQLPQEIRTSVAKDAASSTTATALELKAGKAGANQLADNISAAQTNAKIDLTTAASGKSDVAAVVADSTASAVGKAGANQLADNISAAQANAKIDLTTAAPGKSDVATVATDKPALHSGPGLEITKSVELSNGLPSAAQSAQGSALSAVSMAISGATSGITSGILANNKAADNLQTISSPLGSSGWSDEFSQKISWMSTQRNQVAELHLNPPNLGPLDVVLKISDNQATAMFTSPHSAVRDAVENAMPRLREMLADNGITLGNTTVSDQSPRDRSANGFLGNGSGTAAQRESADGASRLAGLSAAAQPVPMRRHNGMVDTFA